MKFITVADKPMQGDGQIILALNPVMVSAGEDPEKNSHELIGKLQLESMTPATYRIAQDVTLPICIYTVPGNDNVSALAFYDDGDTFIFETNDLMVDAKKSKSIRAINMIQQFMMK